VCRNDQVERKTIIIPAHLHPPSVLKLEQRTVHRSNRRIGNSGELLLGGEGVRVKDPQ
jgi:hypothetical protein